MTSSGKVKRDKKSLRAVVTGAGLPINTPLLKATIAALYWNVEVASLIKGGGKDFSFVNVTRRIDEMLLEAGWPVPSGSTHFLARKLMRSHELANEHELAVMAAVIHSGMVGGRKASPMAIARLVSRYLRSDIPQLPALPEVKSENSPVMVETRKEPAVRNEGYGVRGVFIERSLPPPRGYAEGLWLGELKPLLQAGRLEDFKAALAMDWSGREGKTLLGALLILCAETVPGRVGADDTCPYCLAILGAGASLRCADAQGRKAHQLANGRTAAILRVAGRIRALGPMMMSIR